MPKINANNININYETVGQGPDVVMIHGFASSLAFWYFSSAPFLKEDFKITIYDLRGHGNSENPLAGYTLADMAGDLDGLINNLGIGKVHLVGHSIGGLIALHYTINNPKRVMKLVIADTNIPEIDPERGKRPILNVWIDMLNRFNIKVEEDKADDIDYLISLSEELKSKRFGMFKFGRASQYQKTVYLLKNTTLLKDFRTDTELSLEKIKSLKHPILGIYGEKSHTMKTCDYLSKNLVNYKTIIVPNSAHRHPLEKPDFFAEKVRDFLKD